MKSIGRGINEGRLLKIAYMEKIHPMKVKVLKHHFIPTAMPRWHKGNAPVSKTGFLTDFPVRFRVWASYLKFNAQIRLKD